MGIKPTGYSLEESEPPRKHAIELKATGLARLTHLFSYVALPTRGSNALESQYGDEIRRKTSAALRKLNIEAPEGEINIAWDRDSIYGVHFSR